MPSYPTITKGLGKLTPSLWNRLMALLQWFEVNRAKFEGSKQPGLEKKYFLAKITANDAIVGEYNRYTYTWTEVILDEEYGFITRYLGLTGDAALNLCEMSNVEDNVAPGVDRLGSAYPAGFGMRAIGDCIDSTYIDALVVMFIVRDIESAVRYVFCLGNAHDGTCTL